MNQRRLKLRTCTVMRNTELFFSTCFLNKFEFLGQILVKSAKIQIYFGYVCKIKFQKTKSPAIEIVLWESQRCPSFLLIFERRFFNNHVQLLTVPVRKYGMMSQKYGKRLKCVQKYGKNPDCTTSQSWYRIWFTELLSHFFLIFVHI